MKSLYLIRGLPSSGKSTLAEQLSENGKYPVLSADMYFEDADGNYNWDGSKIKDAHAWCKSVCGILMNHHGKDSYTNVDVISPNKLLGKFGNYHRQLDKIFVANTFTQEWEMQDYINLAEQYGYQVFTIIVENRHGNKNTHDVPDDKVEMMRNRFQIKL